MIDIIKLIFQNVLLAGLLYVLLINLCGRKIPQRFRKKIFVVILVLLLIGMVNKSWGSGLARLILLVMGLYMGFKFLCE